MHKDVLEAFGIKLGDTITVNVLGRDITGTIANVRELDWRTMQLNFANMACRAGAAQPRVVNAGVATSARRQSAGDRGVEAAVTAKSNVTTVRLATSLDRINEITSNIGGGALGGGITLIADAGAAGAICRCRFIVAAWFTTAWC
ncbi:MAG: hypothetical protein U1F68_08950 [Gammaproteobacteria bacterium]